MINNCKIPMFDNWEVSSTGGNSIGKLWKSFRAERMEKEEWKGQEDRKGEQIGYRLLSVWGDYSTVSLVNTEGLKDQLEINQVPWRRIDMFYM